jgi:hypothetical protein
MKVSKQYIPYQRQALSKDWLQRLVQIHRIRLKLRDYAVEGSGAPILIHFPTGRYLPIFELHHLSRKVEWAKTSLPKTGNALRDRAHTWTSSVFRVFAHEPAKRGRTSRLSA